MDELKLSNWLIPKHKTNLIRFGSQYDGGYLLNEEDLLKSDLLISLGIHENWDFEEQIYKNYRMKNVILFDPQSSYFLIFFYLIKSLIKCNFRKMIEYIKKFKEFSILKSNCIFIKKKFKENLVVKYMDSKNILLKIDIEGDEYSILNFILNNQNKINCLVIEFHNINKYLYEIKDFVSNFNLKLVHTHVNTFSTKDNIVLELTFSKNANILSDKWDQSKLNKIDFPNHPNHNNIKIYS